MEPIVNNFVPPKPADLDTLSQDQSNVDSQSNVNLPNGLTEQAVIAYAKARNSAWESWFGPKMKLVTQNRELWRNSTRGKGSTIPMAVAYALIESVVARMNTSMLGRPKFVEAVSKRPQPDNGLQEIIENFINQCLSTGLRPPEVGKAAIKCALMDAITIIRSTWQRTPIESPDSQYQKDPQTGESLFMGQQSAKGFSEEWKPVKKSIANCAWDFHVTTKVQDSEWFRETDWMSYNALLRWQQEGRIKNVESLKRIVPSGSSNETKNDFEAQLKKADGDDKWRMKYADEKLYRIDEWYAYMTYTDKADPENPQTKVYKGHFFIVENEKLVQIEENDLIPCRHPYVSSYCIQDPDSVIGLSLVEAVKPLLDAINTYAGKQQSLVEWCSNPTIFYGNKSGLSGRTTFSRPMGMQPVDDATDIKEFIGNPQSVKVVQDYMEFLIGQAREASGANEQFQGIEGADTATEFQGLQAAAGSRFADLSDTMNQSLIEPLALEAYWFYRQFGVDGQMIVHPQSEESAAVALTKEMLQGEYRFVAVSSSSENYRRSQVQDDTTFVSEMMDANKNGIFAPMQYNVPKHITEISMPLRGQKSSKDMFIPMPPPPPMPMMPPMGGTGGPPPMMQHPSGPAMPPMPQMGQ